VGGGLLTAVLILARRHRGDHLWSRRQFAVLMFSRRLRGVSRAQRDAGGDSFPAMMAGLFTSQPLQLQLAVLLGTSVVGSRCLRRAWG